MFSISKLEYIPCFARNETSEFASILHIVTFHFWRPSNGFNITSPETCPKKSKPKTPDRAEVSLVPFSVIERPATTGVPW